MHPRLGYLEYGGGSDATGTTLGFAGAPAGWAPPALPSRCPSCGHSERQLRFARGDVRSPIRAHTQGNNQAIQLLVSQIVRSTGEEGETDKTIVFTDSRDDAASTAIGLASNHYADLVRQLVGQALEREDEVTAILRAGAVAGGLPPARATAPLQPAAAAVPGRGERLLGLGTGGQPALKEQVVSVRGRARGDDLSGAGPTLSSSSPRPCCTGRSSGGPAGPAAWLEDGSPWNRVFDPPEAGGVGAAAAGERPSALPGLVPSAAGQVRGGRPLWPLRRDSEATLVCYLAPTNVEGWRIR